MWVEIEKEVAARDLRYDSKTNYFAINPRFPAETRAQLLEQLQIVPSDLRGHIFLLSSGTTSKKAGGGYRWIALSHRAFLAAAGAVNEAIQSTASDVWLNPLPLFHVGGNAIWARASLSGAKVVSLPEWNVSAFLQSVEENRVSLTALVPAQIFDLLQKGGSAPPSLRAVFVGGGALAPSLYLEARKLGWPLLPTYGMTESSSQLATASLKSLEGSLVESPVKSHEQAMIPPLVPLPGVQMRVNAEGRLDVWSPGLLTSLIYEENGKTLILDPKQDGWFATEDYGQLGAEGLRVLGRKGEFVKIGGESVEFQRLNEILASVRLELGVAADLAVVPLPDERLGHVVGLFSDHLLQQGQADQVIAAFGSRVLAIEKIRKWHSMEKLPRTALGKLISSECLNSIKEIEQWQNRSGKNQSV